MFHKLEISKLFANKMFSLDPRTLADESVCDIPPREGLGLHVHNAHAPSVTALWPPPSTLSFLRQSVIKMTAIARFPSEDGLSIQTDGVEGIVKFQDVEGGCQVTIFIRGLVPNAIHALHIHEGRFHNKSELTRKGCKILGKHFNPDNTAHGSVFVPEAQRHAGDLINNVFANNDGVVHVIFFDELLRVNSKTRSPIGHSIVLHEFSDDLGISGVLFTKKYGQMRSPRTYRDMKKLLFAPYCEMNDLRVLQIQRYPDKKHYNPAELLTLFETESTKSGNAGGRIACANIVESFSNC